MIYFNLLVLFFSLLFYIILAGADFGAGILELFKGKELRKTQEKLITNAMGPVWESNHMWLILAIVITFVGFPKIYTELSIIYHIPLSMILIGIVFRGSAFTFRHYDAIQDKNHNIYSLVFSLSSLWTILWMGILVGSLVLGDIPKQRIDFYLTFIKPWFNFFSLLVGLFLSSLLAYVSATFLVAESPDQQCRQLFKKRAIIANIISVLIGSGIFLYGKLENIESLNNFFSNKFSLSLFIISIGILFLQWFFVQRNKDKLLKYLGALQLSLVFIAYLIVQFPFIYKIRGENYGLNILDSMAPQSTQTQLSIALIIGIILIIPPYYYLIKVFKKHI